MLSNTSKLVLTTNSIAFLQDNMSISERTRERAMKRNEIIKTSMTERVDGKEETGESVTGAKNRKTRKTLRGVRKKTV